MSSLKRPPGAIPTGLFTAVFLAYYFLIALAAVANVNLLAIIPHAITIGFIGYGFVRHGLSRRAVVYIMWSIGFAAVTAVFISPRDGLWLLYLFLGYFGMWRSFENRSIDERVFDKFILFCALLCVVWIGSGQSASRIQVIATGGNDLAFFPSEQTEWRINIGPPGSTIHFISTILGMAIISSIYRFFVIGRMREILVLAAYGYLLVFAGARSVGIGVICGVLVIVMCGKRRASLPVTSIVALVVGLVAVYGSAFLAQILPDADGLLSNLLKSGNSDITSGRAWLWGFHLSHFYNDPLGTGSALFRDLMVGDISREGDLITAATESYFTYLLAVYGLFALPIFFLYLYVLLKLARDGDLLKASMMVMAIVSTAASSIFSGPYGAAITMLIPFLAARSYRGQKSQLPWAGRERSPLVSRSDQSFVRCPHD